MLKIKIFKKLEDIAINKHAKTEKRLCVPVEPGLCQQNQKSKSS